MEELHSFKGIETMLEDINKMMVRWKAGSMIKHMDLELFERVIHERVDLERQLMIAMETISVLSNKINQNELVLKHFNEEDLEFLRRRISRRENSKQIAQLQGDPEQSS